MPMPTPASTFLYGAHVRSNGIRQHYLRFGGRGTPLILVPGIVSPAALWAFVGERLGQTYDTYVMDVRGRGLSESGPHLDYGLGACADDVIAFARALGLTGYIVLGHSMGARVVVTENAPLSSPKNFQNVARSLAAERGWFLADQFANPANVRAHETTTAQEIVRQVGGPIGAFVVGAGTGGTITGVGRVLKAIDPRVRIVLADPVGSGLAHWIETNEIGPDAAYELEGIGASKPPANLDRTVVDEAVRVTDAESFAITKRLVREEGMLVGGSAGANIAAALRVAARGGLCGPVVTVLCDAWDRYRAKPWMQAWAEPSPNEGT